MPLATELFDNFDDNSKNVALWQDPVTTLPTYIPAFSGVGGVVAETGGKLSMTGAVSQADRGNGYISVASDLDLRDSSYTIDIDTAPTAAAGGGFVTGIVVTNAGAGTNSYRIEINNNFGTTTIGFFANNFGNAGTSPPAAIPFDAVNHRRLRIRHSTAGGGTVFWETAPLGSNTWTVQRTMPSTDSAYWVPSTTRVAIYIAQQTSNATPRTVVYDNFNTTAAAAAVLSSPTPSGTLGTQTTATVGATTDQNIGTLFAVVDTAANLSGVTAAQIKAGQRNNGSAAAAAGSSAVSTTTPSVAISGLAANTLYSYALIQNNTNGDSNIVTGTFTTAALAAPTLTSPPSTLVPGQSYTVNGTNLGASGGTVTVGGVAATVTAQNATSVTFTVNLGTQLYGAGKSVVFTRASDSQTTSFTAVLNPPSGFSVVNLTSVNGTAANRLTATPSDLEAGDQLEYENVGGGVTVNADATFTAAEGVTEFDVRANDGTGWGSYGTQLITFNDGSAPSQPGALSFSAITETSATASWGAATDNVGVTQYRYRLNGGSWVTLGNVLTVNLTGLSPGTSYTVDVQAGDLGGNWSISRTSAFTSADTTAPTVPPSLSFSGIGPTSATATWTASTDNVGVTQYRYRINGGAWVTLGNVLTASLTGLAPSTLYSVDVQAGDAVGNWSGSRTNSFTTTAIPDTTPPNPPTNLTFSSIAATSATANWLAGSDNIGVTQYRYRLNGGAWVTLGNVLTAALTGLLANTLYNVDVQAGDAAGNWSSSLTGSFTTPVPADVTAPSPPSGVTAVALDANRVRISFTESVDAESGVVAYIVTRVGGPSDEFSAPRTSAVVGGLAPSTGYQFTVAARNGAGLTSAQSAQASATTPAASGGGGGGRSVVRALIRALF